LRLDSGNILFPVTIAWSHYGVRPEKARAIIVLLHGISSSPQALNGNQQPPFCDRGWFSGWIGPGKIFDTRHDCILAPNALGSCYGSSGPASCASPGSFPEITIGDTVRSYKLWLTALGIDRRQWLQLRVATLQRYGYAEYLADTGCARIDERLATEATQWAGQFSAWSMACLRKAAMDFNVETDIRAGKINTSLFWMNCSSDALFPCGFAGLEPNADITVHCVDGKYGHMSPVLESELWINRLKSYCGLFIHA